MAAFGDYLFDFGLNELDVRGTRMDLCSSLPTTYAAATSTYTLGNKTGLSIPAPADRTGGGREVTIPAVTDGVITGTGTASYYAITDPTNSRLLAAGSLQSGVSLSGSGTWTSPSFKIGIPDPA
jgi:hypothetical protein